MTRLALLLLTACSANPPRPLDTALREGRLD